MLVNEYGFDLAQMSEELEVTGRGSGHARADFVIWRTTKDKLDENNPLIIVECKSDNVTIKPDDYGQGDNYSRLSGARFFVTHNSRETKYWRVVHEKMPKSLEEISNIPHVDATDKEIEELISKLKTFKEDEFADLLHQCHNVIRNREKLDPAAAFDEIAKILFVKVFVERELREKRQRILPVGMREIYLSPDPTFPTTVRPPPNRFTIKVRFLVSAPPALPGSRAFCANSQCRGAVHLPIRLAVRR